jgi:DNA-binding NtrC family response regulator
MIAITEKLPGSSGGFSPDNHPAPAPARSRIRVWLTDDNVGFRSMLAHLLDQAGEFACERQFHSAESLLVGLTHLPAPDVILLDLEMGGMTGVDALRPIRALAPNVRVLIVTTFFDPMYETRASRDGASAFLLKAAAAQNIVGEIHRALASPVHLQDCASARPPRKVTRGKGTDVRRTAGSAAGNRKGPLSRLALWMIHLSNSLFGLLDYHHSANPK